MVRRIPRACSISFPSGDHNDLREVSVTYNSNSIGTTHVDLGAGRQERVVKYRFNGVFGEGDGYVDGSHQKRELGDLGVDVQPWKAPYSNSISATTASPIPAIRDGLLTAKDQPAVDAGSQVGGLRPGVPGTDLKTQTSIARLKHEFNSNCTSWSVR